MIYDVNQFGVCIKPKAITTLNNMRKADLIEYIQTLEHNYNVAVTFNEQQARNCEALLKDANKQNWIPCKKRQPTENGNYLAVVRSWDETANIDFIDVDHCNYDGYWLHYHDSAKKKTGRRVIAWMPLPELYKEGDQE